MNRQIVRDDSTWKKDIKAPIETVSFVHHQTTNTLF
jgi:hypothetical protein